jgi:hypothetical protein
MQIDMPHREAERLLDASREPGKMEPIRDPAANR